MNEQDRDQIAFAPRFLLVRLERLEKTFADSLGSLEDRIGKGIDRMADELEAINGHVRDHAERIAKIEGARDSERLSSRKAGLAGGGVVAVVVGAIEAIRRYLESGA